MINLKGALLSIVIIVLANILLLNLYADLGDNAFDIQSIDMAVAVLAILDSLIIIAGVTFFGLKFKTGYSLSNLLLIISIILLVADVFYIKIFSLNLDRTWDNKILLLSLLFLGISTSIKISKK
jgi:hypothetical protein